jgi:hypothetical protein
MDCAVHARGGATPAGPLSPFALTLTGRIIVVVVSKEAHEIRHAIRTTRSSTFVSRIVVPEMNAC